jgi:hypothetical protein
MKEFYVEQLGLSKQKFYLQQLCLGDAGILYTITQEFYVE